jgi:hypothetical protein
LGLKIKKMEKCNYCDKIVDLNKAIRDVDICINGMIQTVYFCDMICIELDPDGSDDDDDEEDDDCELS